MFCEAKLSLRVLLQLLMYIMSLVHNYTDRFIKMLKMGTETDKETY